MDRTTQPDNSQPSPGSPAQPALSAEKCNLLRSVGIAVVITLCTILLTHVHDGVVLQRDIGLQDYSAPALLGCFFIFVCINVVLSKLVPGLSARASELALALTLMLATVPLHRFIAHFLVTEVGLIPSLLDTRNKTVEPLQKYNPFTSPDSVLSLTESRKFDASLINGRSSFLNPALVPWSVWIKPLLFWLPLIFSYLIVSISMGYLLFRQWALNELVQFPIAEYATMLIRRKPGKVLPEVFGARVFWAGVILMLVIFSSQGLHLHFEKMIVVPTKFSYFELSKQFPFMNDALEGYSLLRGTLYFTMIAIAFILPLEISFTTWFTWIICVVATYFFFTQTGRRFTPREMSMVNLGSWYAMAILILYTGRWHYLNLLKAAVGLGMDRSMIQSEKWLSRLLLLGMAAMSWCLWRLGLAWDLAILWTLCTSVMMLVLCRLVAEMGLFWTPLEGATPMKLLSILFGEAALGAKSIGVSAMAGSFVMPYNVTAMPMAPAVCNAAQVESSISGRHRSILMIVPWSLAALAASVAVLIWLGYWFEGPQNDVPRLDSIANAAKTAWRLGGASAVEPSIVTRWTTLAPESGFAPLFALGAAIVLVTGLLRLRLPRMPLHPLPLVLLGTWLMSRLWIAFLIGWFLKTIIIKIGGTTLLAKSKPFFCGILVGLALTLTIWMIANICIFFTQGQTFDPLWWSFMNDMYPS